MTYNVFCGTLNPTLPTYLPVKFFLLSFADLLVNSAMELLFSVCSLICLFVHFLTRLLEKLSTDCHEAWMVDWAWPRNE